MEQKQEVVRELNRLMDEQLKVLELSLKREEAIEYAMRAARIKELLAILHENEASN